MRFFASMLADNLAGRGITEVSPRTQAALLSAWQFRC